MTRKASAFVIMPLSDEFNSVYTDFIQNSLNEVGYEVERADDIESQRSILSDILEKINTSNLIVADLTSVNPNVFYELGLAHALRKPVILLTQDIEEVPFDLQSYRLVEYSTHFAQIQDAKDKLKSYGEGFLNGTVAFGNPVTDFLGTTYSIDGPNVDRQDDMAVEKESENGEAESGDLGFLDHTILLQEGNDRIAKIIARSTTDLSELTDSILISTNELNGLSNNPNADTPRAARAISRRLAAKIDEFAQKIRSANYEYADLLRGMEDSLEFVITFQKKDLNDTEGTKKLLAQLESFLKIAADARDSFLNLALQMDYVPRMEGRLSRALSSGSLETRTMANNIERQISAVSRVQQKYP